MPIKKNSMKMSSNPCLAVILFENVINIGEKLKSQFIEKKCKS